MWDMDFAKSVTKLSDEEHEDLVEYYRKRKPSERIAIHALQTVKSRKKNRQYQKSYAGAFYYAAFLLAIKEYRDAHPKSALSRRMTDDTSQQIDDLRKIKKEAKPPRKASKARLAVEKYFDEIAAWRAEEKPWRTISELLGKKHKKRISHTSLATHFAKLERERSSK